MIYAYIRVSTQAQNIQNQKFEIESWCRSKNIVVDRFVEETVSGKIFIDCRVLGRLLRKLREGDILVVTELSRLGRSMLDVVEKINFCLKNKIKIFSIKEKFELNDSIVAKTLIFAFTISAEIERTLISQRTREALVRRKSEGIKLGRPKGSKNAIERNPCYLQRKKIINLYEAGISQTKIAKQIGVHRDTLRKFLSRLNELNS